MIVGIIGSGGREHAICHALNKSKKIDKIYCFPGNAGTDTLAENINLDINNFEEIKNFILSKKIEIVVIGPEKPLVDGLTDYLESFDIKVFGPSKVASQLEGSKIFTKNICKKYNIPTASFGVFNDPNQAKNFLNNSNFPIVIKADNLAAGKGVYICENKEESYQAVKEIFDGKFGAAKNVLIEEFLEGEEMSFFILSDGITYKNFGTAQDHKRVQEGDKGKNTGGMGAYSPSRLINEELEKKILNNIIDPTLRALKDLKSSYKGFLYAGLMIKNNEPYLIEYNVRMGDPECQTILPRLKTDLFEIIDACVNKKLESIKLEWFEEKSLCIVLCSKGYPDQYEKNLELKDVNNIKLEKNDYIFHAGTEIDNSKVYSNGGRVLNFVVKSKNLKDAREHAIDLINELNWENGFFRRDIGYKIIKT